MRLLARGLSAAALLLAPLAALPSAAAQPDPAPSAPLMRSGRAVPNQYIVTLGKSVQPASFVKKVGVRPMFSYGTVMRGFAATLTPSQVSMLRRTPGVTAVEENGRVDAFGDGPARVGQPRGRRNPLDLPEPGLVAPRMAQSWGLDRIDQRDLPLDHRFSGSDDGRGATAYIMDTGIDYGHDEFGGRAVPGLDTVGDGRAGADCNGHGTHVAGTVAGRDYGVAPAARLVSVRVLNCTGNGTWAQVLAGMDWVAANAVQPAVLNASLGGPYSQAVNEATDALARTGVLPVVAAGNATQDACGVSPASADHALTVGATDRDDRQTAFSNYGACVSLFAPGKDIVSALIGGGSVAEDGTSMASPHAAGVALLYKAEHPSASSDQVAAWMLGTSTKDVLSVDHGSPNRLLYTGGL
ncbi:S8 family peptidase [Streptomyces sp. HPF1205]|uniref:S8 family peptidase n=1 Tax=Streptomyces sp. HPF1205 TaxID=2873262 RepID=UPI001CEC98F5|nr:S8 family peptidase [Streptomyces sp. HPF1205]